MKIPLDRIKQIQLHQAESQDERFDEDEIRVMISGGGSLSFVLSQWTDSVVEGMSRPFGPVRFDAESIRQVELNLEKHRLEHLAAQEDPEDVWDFETEGP